MSQARLIELDCDGELCWSGPYRSTTDDLSEARRQVARYNGWSYDENTDEDFCRKCTKIREGGDGGGLQVR